MSYPPPPPPPNVVYVERKRRRVWPWVLLGVAVVTLGGCALLAVAVNEAADELDAERRRHAITRQQFDSVPLGTPRAEVEAMLGKPPENAQEFVTEGVLDETEIRSSCIYYNRAGGTFGDFFQFCFDGDALRSKNAY